MKKLTALFGIIIVMLTMLFVSNIGRVDAAEITTNTTTAETVETSATEPIVADEVMTELEVQIERVKTFIIALVVSILGTASFGFLAKLALNSIIKLARDKIAVAETKNELSSQTAQTIYGKLNDFETKGYEKIDELVQINRMLVDNNAHLSADVKSLIDEMRARDAILSEILEQELGADTGGVPDGTE